MERVESQPEKKPPPPTQDSKHLVTVTVDGTPRPVPKGKYLVSEFKALLDVPVEYELDRVEAGRFEPLADDASLHIKGDEVFVSHVRRGGSS